MVQTEKTANVTFDDRAAITDLLSSQKFITGLYNSYLNESETSSVISSLASILDEEHKIQNEIFTDMSERGWYQTEKAEDTKVQKAVGKYQPDVTK